MQIINFQKLKEIDLNDIKDEPLILLDLPLSREYFLSIFEAQNIKPKISEKTSQISVLRSLVAHNFGYSLANLQLGIPQSIDGLKISQIPLKGEHQSLELGLAIADLNYIPSLTNEFIEFAKQFIKKITNMNTNNKIFKTDNKYQVLFEPIKIGPVIAKNRFYQVPHCNGGGYRDPSAAAEMRNIKSEGGWGVVFTEQVEMHHTSEITPYIELRLWDDRDIKIVSKMADKIHEYDTLAGIELTYPGINGPNLYTKEVPMAATAGPILTFTSDPVNAREMDKEDIRNLRKWFRQAARRSKIAGFDIICLYGAHGFGAIQHFLSRSTNHRIDEYGGSLENRSRLMKELTEEVMDEVGDTMAVSIRLSLQEIGDQYSLTNNEIRDCIEMHSSLPDLWDLAQGAWEDCSGTSRFVEEGAQQDLIQGIKSLTDKPVVGVGRFTSPDLMVKQIKSGNLDFIGAARPSIADPFLPNKIRDGKIDDIRECIGCNICVTGDMTMSISRCTQNPSFMEEWRKGWHPENFQIKGESKSILIIGSGPAGLEATRCLSKRGYDVTLAEKDAQIGGRVSKERLLPGLSAWGRGCRLQRGSN